MGITKEKLKDYLKDKFDIVFNQIVQDLDVKEKEFEELNRLLDELVNEKWIKKSKCISGEYEYDPGEKLNYGGLSK